MEPKHSCMKDEHEQLSETVQYKSKLLTFAPLVHVDFSPMQQYTGQVIGHGP